MKIKASRTGLFTADGLEIYDIQPQSSQLWAIAGPDEPPLNIDLDNLPTGWRWVDDEEWHRAEHAAYWRKRRKD